MPNNDWLNTFGTMYGLGYGGVYYAYSNIIILPECTSTSAFNSEVASYPDIEFLFGDKWIMSKPEDYIIYADTYCFICILPQDSSFYLYGDSLLRGYYSTHDYDNLRHGFVPKGSDKPLVYAGT